MLGREIPSWLNIPMETWESQIGTQEDVHLTRGWKGKKSAPNVVSLSDSDSKGQLSEEKKNINLQDVSSDSDWTSDDDDDE